MITLLIILMTLAMVYLVQVSALFRIYREREVFACFAMVVSQNWHISGVMSSNN